MNIFADSDVYMMMCMSNIRFLMEITVVMFIFPVRLEMIEFERVESWSMKWWDILICSVVVFACQAF